MLETGYICVSLSVLNNSVSKAELDQVSLPDLNSNPNSTEGERDNEQRKWRRGRLDRICGSLTERTYTESNLQISQSRKRKSPPNIKIFGAEIKKRTLMENRTYLSKANPVCPAHIDERSRDVSLEQRKRRRQLNVHNLITMSTYHRSEDEYHRNKEELNMIHFLHLRNQRSRGAVVPS